MNIQAVDIKSKFMERLLEQPNKRHVAVFPTFLKTKAAWADAVAVHRTLALAGVSMLRLEFSNMMIHTPEGGFMMFKSVPNKEYLANLRGMEISSFFVEDFEHGLFRNEVIMALKCRVR